MTTQHPCALLDPLGARDPACYSCSPCRTQLHQHAARTWAVTPQALAHGRVRRPAVPRLTLTPDEAAAALGIGRTTFYERVLPELRVIPVGRKKLISIRELEAWIDRSASRIV